MLDADVLLTSGTHAGKRIGDLTDNQLRCVWSGFHGNEQSKQRPEYLPLTRQLYQREGKPIPSWAMPKRLQPPKRLETALTAPPVKRTPQSAISVESLLMFFRDQPGFTLFYEIDRWMVACDAYDGWKSHSDLRCALARAREAVTRCHSKQLLAV